MKLTLSQYAYKLLYSVSILVIQEVIKTSFRLAAKINFLVCPDCIQTNFEKVWMTKNHMKCDFRQSNPSHSRRWFKIKFQTNFYRCIWFAFQSVFCVTRNVTHTTTTSIPDWAKWIWAPEQNPFCLPQSVMKDNTETVYGQPPPSLSLCGAMEDFCTMIWQRSC